METALTVLGCVLFVYGLPWFASPGWTTETLARIETLSPGSVRMTGWAIMAAGLFFVYLARG